MNNWIDYWNRKESMQDKFWQKQAYFSAAQICKEMKFDKENSVLLDIGCGHGFVIERLAPFVKQAYGIDTSDINIKAAKERFCDKDNLAFYSLLPDRYLDIDKLNLQPVTHIICISVLQYYKSLEEICQLLANMKKIVAGGGGPVLLADLLIDYNFVKDSLGILWGDFLSGLLFSNLKEVFSTKHSHIYSKVRQQSPLLTIKHGDLEKICKQENASLTFLKHNVTACRFRKSAIIEIKKTK
jgi:SAM-dependent methyltransferase